MTFDKQYDDATPNKDKTNHCAIAEAMAAGLPVVLTPGIQISEEVAAADAGLVVEGEIESLSSAIAQLLASPDLREKMGQNGKQLVRDRYSWEVIAQELIKNYSAIIQQANR